ncbi:hypothetical protein [Mogibacterium diversum]|uniref:hypothetical protein n=1 Tax=Mogibacterium diversum TaxID=114527 RepID=UPI0028EFC40B|nr:hypothetical protein [Mogibacterium diversum]
MLYFAFVLKAKMLTFFSFWCGRIIAIHSDLLGVVVAGNSILPKNPMNFFYSVVQVHTTINQKNESKQEFDKFSWEQKRIKEAVRHIQICISKREHYEGYRKNPKDKIYMMMNRKDAEAYQKSYEEIDIFIKQFSYLKDTALGEMRSKSSKNLFSEVK